MRRIQTNEHANPSHIIGIQFSTMSREEILKTSVVSITSKDNQVSSVMGGLSDPKMGVLKQGAYCPTDGYTYINCPGYFGHIVLARPVFHIQWISSIIGVSKGVCLSCGRALKSKANRDHWTAMSPEERWEYATKHKLKRCGDKNEGGCGALCPTSIKIDGFATIRATWKLGKHDEPITQDLTPEFLYRLFQRISDDDVNFLGMNSVFSRPENMICSVLLVMPPAGRPSVEQDAQQRSEDDLTHIYMNIIKNNSILMQKIQENAAPNIINKHHMMIQYFVAMIANNKVAGTNPLAQPSGRPLQCIRDRLDAKQGRIRSNLMGKRVDFSARSVITGDPNLDPRELGVPVKIAMNLTNPTTVNERNYSFLLKLVQNGPDIYPGAKIIDCINGDQINLRAVDRLSIRLNLGDVVHRHMLDGDAVLFNRQPSLHKMSMMCHIARIMMTGHTFRFNVAVTNPYNADFDGDEMNLHKPQGIEADVELRYLPAVENQMISPTKNAPIIGIFQDSMLGANLFTQPGLTFSVAHAMRLLALYPHLDVRMFEGKTRVTNYEILSQITPAITLRMTNDFGTIDIRNGVWISGRVNKASFGAGTKGILHRICNDFGNVACVDFIHQLQNIVNEYMKVQSFSVGISDLVASEEAKRKIAHSVIEGKDSVIALNKMLRLGLFVNHGAQSNAAEFETQVSNALADARGKMEKIGHDSLSKTNRFRTIVDSGAKGSQINISQMISCLGQQSIEGKRAPYGYDNRTLPHFNKYDDTAAARGFVDSSYIQGLNPCEMFFHAMAGRIGLIDTAVKTSQTGYAQRRLVKSMEDVVVLYDGTVRNHMGKIVQFAYGDDGFDSTKVETQKFPLVSMSTEDIYMKYDLVAVNVNDASSQLYEIFTQAAKQRIGKQRLETKRMCQKYIDKMEHWRDELVVDVFGCRNEDQVRLPVSFSHIIDNAHGSLGLNGLNSRVVDITPLEAFEMIEAYYHKLVHYSKYVVANRLFEALYYFYLSPKELLYERRFGRQTLTLLLETVLMRTKQALVQPGEMVGVIAAQSVGEPATQLTLNTFHSAGVASKANVTHGVPRVDEILRLTENPKNSSLTICPFTYDEQDQSRAAVLASLVECTVLKDVVRSVQVIYDPSDDATLIQEDRDMILRYKTFNETFRLRERVDPESLSPFIIRMVFDPRVMLDKNITMDDVQFAITSMYGSTIQAAMQSDDTNEMVGGDARNKKRVHGAVHCIYSDFNDNNLVFRIRIGDFIKGGGGGSTAASAKNKTARGLDLHDEINYIKLAQDAMLSNIVLRGVGGIRKVIPRKLKNMLVRADGKYAPKEVWVLDTTGTNLLEVLGLPYIDYQRTVSNDIREVQNVLGIEAARQVVLNELTEVMEFSDVYINYHHRSLLADRMSYSKNMVAVYRTGINKDDIGPIAKATFEMHTEMLLNAARHGHLDNMRGVSANVMCGQPGHYGTNAFKVHLNLGEYEKQNAAVELRHQQSTQSQMHLSRQSATSVYDVDKTIESMFGDVLLPLDKQRVQARTGMCTVDSVSIPNYLSDAAVLTTDRCLNDGYDLGI